MEQKRLLLALVLSAVILLGWSYFFQPPPAQPNSNTSPPAGNSSQSVVSSPETTIQSSEPLPSTENIKLSEDTVKPRTLTISTPLYEVEIDSRGAVVKSWVIKENKDTGRPLYSIASKKEEKLPLQLVSPEGLSRGETPLRLEIGKPNSNDTENLELVNKWNEALRARNFEISGNGSELTNIDGDESRPLLNLNSGEQKKRIEFKLVEPESGLQVTKSLVFDPNSYIVNIELKVTQRERPVPNVKMFIGPSIGDHGVPQYTFYSVAPEAVAVAKGDAVRLHASEVHEQKSSQEPGKGYKSVDGPVDWAAIGDTYFAMALVLPKPAERIELTTEEYQHTHHDQKESRYLISAYVPVPVDGSTMHLYVGPKDHFALADTSQELSQQLGGREIDLEKLIDYGWLGFTRPIAVQLLKAIKFLNNLTGNYGIAIILFTIIIYMLFFPLKWRSTKSMKKAQKHAPRMKELQAKIKGLKSNDPRLKELQMEQLRLMKEANPLGGCLPLLIQMPFLIALYSAITISIDFRQASFLWMPDLSAADPLRLLPILMAVSMVVLQLITPAPSADPLQRKMMAVILPVMMLYMLWSAPSGLLLYWLVGNIVGFGQQLVINRLVKSEDDGEPPERNKAEKNSKKQNLSEPRVSQA